ncbi:MAG: hypothetical protein LH481_02760 [Burkholderiales bacterium]|nr:hypothetical protein [Burkholderiales bacterium]
MVNSVPTTRTGETNMALGKFGAFLNRDLGALAKDAGKMLNTDLSTIAKGAGRVLQSDLGDLLRDKPGTDKPAEEPPAPAPAAPAPVAKNSAPAPAVPFDPDATQKMERVATSPPRFDPDATQKMDAPPLATAPTAASDAPADKAAAAPIRFGQELLIRSQRTVPAGNEVIVLLPHSVGDFERPRATPSGNLTNDPVNAVYSGRGESVLVQLALSWDADEARQLVDEVSAIIGQGARSSPDRTWVFGPTNQGLVFAWTRDCYFFTATSPKGAPALARFLAAYDY